MKLKIVAIQYKGQPLSKPLTAVFSEDGGTIGRSSANHLVLVDEEKVVSSKHAVIQFENGCYYYIDDSTNGTWFTHRDQWVHHEKIMLHDQDEVSIGDYDIIITVSKSLPEIQSPPPEKSFFPAFDYSQAEEKPSSFGQICRNDHNDISAENINSDRQTELAAPVENDFPALTDGLSPPVSVDANQKCPDLPQNLSLEDFFVDESKERSDSAGENDGALKENEAMELSSPSEDKRHLESFNRVDILPDPKVQSLDESAPIQVPKKCRTEPERDEKGEVTADYDDALDAFLKALGVADSTTWSQKELTDLMSTTGLVIQELVEGLMSILRGRTELKSQLRVSVTTIKKRENNPLKFSPSSHEALKTLLISKPIGFLTAIDAIREGFEDIKNHQLAITAGVQASLLDILKRFDPNRFEKKYEEGIILQKKTKCWNEYRQSYHQMVAKALDGFFGEAFVRAYEAQNEKLRLERKKTLRIGDDG